MRRKVLNGLVILPGESRSEFHRQVQGTMAAAHRSTISSCQIAKVGADVSAVQSSMARRSCSVAASSGSMRACNRFRIEGWGSGVKQRVFVRTSVGCWEVAAMRIHTLLHRRGIFL